LRPLVAVGDAKETAAISRDHTIFVSNSGLITITGGKWTTYRKMAQDVIDQAELVAGLDGEPCSTERLRIHGWFEGEVGDDRLGEYGSDAEAIRGLETSEPGLDTPLAPGVAVTGAQVIWAVRARASIGAAPAVASLMARELGRDDRWQREVVASYRALALRYVL
jgi:glycerol-3-phosphate dehydrogenase